MTQFQPGDTVMIRPDLKPGRGFAMLHDSSITNSVIEEMVEYAGRAVVVESIFGGQYRLIGLPCCWTDEMLEPLSSLTEVDDLL